MCLSNVILLSLSLSLYTVLHYVIYYIITIYKYSSVHGVNLFVLIRNGHLKMYQSMLNDDIIKMGTNEVQLVKSVNTGACISLSDNHTFMYQLGKR